MRWPTSWRRNTHWGPDSFGSPPARTGTLRDQSYLQNLQFENTYRGRNIPAPRPEAFNPPPVRRLTLGGRSGGYNRSDDFGRERIVGINPAWLGGLVGRNLLSTIGDYLIDQFMPPPISFADWLASFLTAPPSDWVSAVTGGFEFEVPSGWTIQRQCSLIDSLFAFTGHASTSGATTFGAFNNPVCSGPSTTNINNRTAATFAADLAILGPANVGRLIFTQQKQVSPTSKQWAPYVYAYRTKTGGIPSGPDPAGNTFFKPKGGALPYAWVPVPLRLDPMGNPVGRVPSYPDFRGLLPPAPLGQWGRGERREGGYSAPSRGRTTAFKPVVRTMDFGAPPPVVGSGVMLKSPGPRGPAGKAKERKFGALSGTKAADALMRALRAALAATEALDALECIHGALKSGKAKPGARPHEKALAVLNNVDALDIGGMVTCLIANHYEDKAIGKLSKSAQESIGVNITRKMI